MTTLSPTEKDAVRDALVRLRYSVPEIADRTGWTQNYVWMALRGDIEACEAFWSQLARMTRNLANAR